jgi:hypothetical protein
VEGVPPGCRLVRCALEGWRQWCAVTVAVGVAGTIEATLGSTTTVGTEAGARGGVVVDLWYWEAAVNAGEGAWRP